MADSEKEAEFAFDLFSDIAPLLALFGDQFARQFASESFTWVDHLIFAMVPLGILTAITGAIRVQGPRIAKSFIGRGRENRALAEIELMSSTSKEVCELFNGKSIIRAMGRPKLAQILVYPREYERAKINNERNDLQRLMSPDTREEINDSCGIHTFETATSDSGSLLAVYGYHSKSYEIIKKLLCSVMGKKNLRPEDSLNPKDVFKWLGPPNLQLGLASDQFQQNYPTRGQETLIAALIAVLLQSSLLAIATVTVYHAPTRQAIASEPQIYGYPCYLMGSVLLSMGIAICSLVVERSTIECNWTVYPHSHQNDETKLTEASSDEQDMAHNELEIIPGKLSKDGKDHPRLLWLQQSQEVNDQSFDGYAILAGPKHHLVTSSIEDTGLGSSISAVHKDGNTGPGHVKQEHWSNDTWEYITVGAAIAAGVGFIMQFMGLRGLTYPCSIAQLIAILLMAFVRAVIRRRLGREPSYCPTFARFEIDFLTTRLVYYKAFRNFDFALKDNIRLLNRQSLRELLCWRVRTARDNKKAFFAKTVRDLREEHASSDTTEQGPRGSDTYSITETVASSPLDEASSQHLLRVRERLGDLCEWKSEALESARSLVYSVEAFMDSFFPKTVISFDWVVETIGLSTERGVDRSDYVSIPVQRIKGKWNVGIGVVDAIISLWMASIEAQAADLRRSSVEEHANRTSGQKSEVPNWRRRKLGLDMRYDFRRILGDDFKDGTLKRDLSWWVGETLIEQTEEKRLSNKAAVTDTKHEDASLKLADSGFLLGSEKLKADTLKLIIGFNGLTHRLDPRREEGRKELAIVSNGLLPNILAQHLFTSFMWTVVGRLPEDCLRQSMSSSEQDVDIEGRHAFDAHHFNETWSRPTLRHRQLMKLVQQLVNFGIGTQDEILLCMIPAFSFKDLLPNRVMLKLIPQVRLGQGWAETARCYNRLLEQSMRVTSHETMAEEKFCFNVLVATIDFLIFASEPYDDYIDPPEELKVELEGIVCRLVSSRFAPVIKKLALAYQLQRRHRDIERIFKLFGTEASIKRIGEDLQFQRVFGNTPNIGECLHVLNAPEPLPDFFFLERALGFSKTYRALYEALYKALPGASRDVPTSSTRAYQFQVNTAKARDIFDWTPLHYAALLEYSPENGPLLYRLFDPENIGEHLSIHKIFGPFGRSPLHMAAISGSWVAMGWVSRCLSTKENKRNAYTMVGIDGMSPLHLATKCGNIEMVEKIIRKKRMRTTTIVDFWGRSAIHLATQYGRDDITSVLLREDPQIDNADEIGMTPLEYLFGRGGILQDIEDSEEDNPGQTSPSRSELGSVQEMHTNLEQPLEDGASEIINDADSRSALDEGSNTGPVEDEDHKESNKSGARSISNSQENTKEMDSPTSNDEQQGLAGRKQKIFLDIASTKLGYHDDRKRTLLYSAIQNTNIETIKRLISMGYELEIKDSAGLTPLHFAIQIRKSNTALKLLRAVPGYDGPAAHASARDDRGYTPLMFAAESGCISVVRYLVESLSGKVQEERGCLLDDEKQKAEHEVETRPSAEADPSGPLARDLEGKTALHIALSRGQADVAAYLLQGPGELQEDPFDSQGNTLLIAACANSRLAACVPLILKKWPGFINKADNRYKQTPLSFACEAGTSSVVDLLLSSEGVDVNAKATGWDDRSCLHTAVIGDCLSIVEKLVQSKGIKINEKDSFGETALDIARNNSGIAKALLLHKETESKARFDFLSGKCMDRDVDYQNIVPDVLPYIEDADITDEDLVDLINVSEELRSSGPFVAFVRRAFERGTPLERPYHKAARVGSLELLDKIQARRKDPSELDEDGWSCIEYGETYRESPLDVSFSQIINSAITEQGKSQEQESRALRPGVLHEPNLNGCVSVEGCSKAKHKDCTDIHVLEVVSSDDNWRATIRTRNCVPPASAKREIYYFEVKILTESRSKLLGLGFCNKRLLDGTMPGWYDISCGYHGDDGALFINSGTGKFPTNDFGPSGMYGVGDTVGAGLNMATGEVFFTLNGVRRNTGEAFKDEKFNGRKMFPCIGFDTSRGGIGLRIEMNLGSCLEKHPFMFKGIQEYTVESG
ncbi:hypothetical protein OPT61_g8136 [Boeremia exigua]|uniref:Uncharacterized protein n=1 Tax=Boeremia exigua TaxID=749465 RepID=A0ACC2I0J3_9PLEO|nr:hypothetical protein OPT61_g8136 [Boeremia exigua]